MNLEVHPDSLQSFAQKWGQAADVMSTHAETLAGVGEGADNFGRINQFFTPVLALFVWQARDLATECGELMDQAVGALCATVRDLEDTDARVASLMRGELRAPREPVWA